MTQLKPTIRLLIHDFHQSVLPSVREGLVCRELSLGKPLQPKIGNLVKVVTGMRRSGKTFRLYQAIIELLDSGVPAGRICYFNFDDERLKPYPADIVSQVLETFYELNPETRSEGAYIFFDEVQDVPGWELAARRIVDTEKVTMYFTGSSSRLLSDDIATEFRGRSIAYELLPYGFSEYLQSRGLDVPRGAELDSKTVASQMKGSYQAFLLEGGFPAVCGLDEMERVQVLQGYVQFTVARDLVERHGYANAAFVRNLARSVVASSARDFSISRAHNQGTSSGYSPGREKIAEMLDAMEDAHLSYGVYDFSRSLQRSRLRGFKEYAVDTGLFYAMSPATTDGLTRALETSVYLELRRRRQTGRRGEVSMFKLPSGKEVDFIWGDEAFGTAFDLVQVCLSMDDERTKVREISALEEAMSLFPGARATIVTLDEYGTEATPHGDIRIVPAWRWTLEKTTR